MKEIFKNFFKKLFDEGIISALYIPVKKGEQIFPALLGSKDFIDDAVLFSPVMPVSGATELSRITKLASPSQPIGVVLKPCEIRAAVELVKIRQINLENILIIGVHCLGTYTPEFYEKEKPSSIEEDKIREVCKMCTYPTPVFGDIELGFLGGDVVKGISEKGKEILEKLGIKETDADFTKIEEIKRNRQKVKDEILRETEERVKGIDNLRKFFERCINCHNCMKVCPICYCHECFFDSDVFRFEGDRYLRWVDKKGILQLPKDALIFHIGRMYHMALSCIGCGMCEQACPRDIDVAHAFILVGREGDKVFNYTPGINIDEPLPLLTFREDEFNELGNEEV